MPLTPEDVSNKRFTPVRLREGYDMGEVDQFLDEVESELERLLAENNDLRSKLAAAQQGGAAPAAEAAAPKAPEPAPQPKQEPVASAATPMPSQEIKVTTVGEASSAAARLLEMATHNADQLVAEAKDEADKIIGAARTKAERLEAESKSRADRMESDARTRSQMLDSETEARRKELFGNLDKEKERLDQEIGNLRAFEREYRSRLKSYFTQQLEALDNGGDLAAGQPGDGAVAAPKRLKSILGEGDDSQARG
jgi:DivIVA domain-containing protein